MQTLTKTQDVRCPTPRCGLRHTGIPTDRSVRVYCNPAKGGCGTRWVTSVSSAVAPVVPPKPPGPVARPPAPAGPKPRLVVAVDATASRQAAWDFARENHDAIFKAVPGQLEVALTVHGGGVMHTWTDWETDASYLRLFMSEIQCSGGETRLEHMLMRALAEERITTILYIGDHLEENADTLIGLATDLAAKQTKIIILHDRMSDITWYRAKADQAAPVFQQMAKVTGGAVLPFDANAPQRVRDMLAAIAVVAAEGRAGLERRRLKLKAADDLLRLLPPDKPGKK